MVANESLALFPLPPQIVVYLAVAELLYPPPIKAAVSAASSPARLEYPADTWARHALAAICDANEEILQERLQTDTGKSRTTLSLALVLPESGVFLYACIGDSHLFQVRRGGAADLAETEDAVGLDCFLGHGQETPESLADKCQIGVEPLEDTIRGHRQ